MYEFRNRVYLETEGISKIDFGANKVYEIAPASEFGGRDELLSPEDMFVGAVNSCLMMTFFYFINKSGISLVSYEASGKGIVEKGKDGLKFTAVNIEAIAVIDSEELTEQIKRAGELAEKYCLVSKSLACDVQYDLQIKVKK